VAPFDLIGIYGTVTCPHKLFGILCGHEKGSATADLPSLLKMRRETQVHQEYA
jgi:hypothetical protein